MNAIFDRMLAACTIDLHASEHHEISPELLRRIVAICAAVAAPVDASETPEGLQHIRAWTLRADDCVWQADQHVFCEVRHIVRDEHAGLMRAEFTDGTMHWFSGDEILEIPARRSIAHDWNERRRVQQSLASQLTDS